MFCFYFTFFLLFFNFIKKVDLLFKVKLFSLYRVDPFTFAPILRQGFLYIRPTFKYLLFFFFFLQFSEFNLKAPPYSKTLHYSRISISRALPPFRSLYNCDHGNSSRGNVPLKKGKKKISPLGPLLLNSQFDLVPADILNLNHGVHPVQSCEHSFLVFPGKQSFFPPHSLHYLLKRLNY